MATMVVLSPITNFSASTLTSRISSDKLSSSTSRVRYKDFLGHGGGDFLSSRRLRSNCARARLDYCSDIEPQSIADESASDLRCTRLVDLSSSCRELPSDSSPRRGRARTLRSVFRCNCSSQESQEIVDKEESIKDASEDSASAGVAIAVKILQFYKREISPILPGSCRFVPTCSEYGMQAFKKYGVIKGAILTAWRLSRCNPLGGSGFDPPRWFDEPRPPPY